MTIVSGYAGQVERLLTANTSTPPFIKRATAAVTQGRTNKNEKLCPLADVVCAMSRPVSTPGHNENKREVTKTQEASIRNTHTRVLVLKHMHRRRRTCAPARKLPPIPRATRNAE